MNEQAIHYQKLAAFASRMVRISDNPIACNVRVYYMHKAAYFSLLSRLYMGMVE